VRLEPLFPAWSNSIFRFTLGAALIGVLAIPCLAMAWVRTPYMTGRGNPVIQPIKFDHRHHVRDDGIDCLYCHSGATRSAYAGIPTVSLCMNCHSQIWTSSPELTQLREAYFANTPIEWIRVHNLPRHVFFNHSIHLAKGVGCVTCHGRVDLMPQVYQEETLLMQWCLDCHRNPEENLRPREEVTNMDWKPSRPQADVGREIRAQLDVHPTTDCTSCHR
jgi:cytochrome c7-like protein